MVERVKAYNPTYVGFTTNISIAYATISQALYLKRALPQIKVVLGGRAFGV